MVIIGTTPDTPKITHRRVTISSHQSKWLPTYCDETTLQDMIARVETAVFHCLEVGVKRVVLSLPGTLNGGSHPVEAATMAIRTTLWKYAGKFESFTVMCPP
eukprot:CAMPEP_0204380256 /NCGR_PEP_ID=MMETSP0469-20131031/53236_1 /ASSEMBLY_ACC=CAM_ASM_000384 /TAXON_ID=2969 /ORGANISM="Oxyrrhis marina" /LENGTH=101 /DNA_ID=CAMNT_0051371855 /DNA_START=55 /DNA_END=356 /DNA_ORIENTATION=-